MNKKQALFGKSRGKTGLRIRFAFLIILVVSLFSCRQFFTTSLAEWAARDPSDLIPKLSSSNVFDLINTFAESPDHSLALLDDIEAALDGANAQETAVLQAAALEAAANASGIVPALMENSNDILESMDDADAIIDLIDSTVNGLDNLPESAALLLEILPDPSDTEAFEAFLDNADPEDLAMAAIVLLASEASASGGARAYIESFDPDSPASDAELMAVALAEAAAAAEGPDGTIADILENLNLLN